MDRKGPVTLKDIRKAKGLTLEDMSRCGGPRTSTYAKIDSGKASTDNVTIKVLIQICWAFEMSPNDLLKTIGYDWTKRPD